VRVSLRVKPLGVGFRLDSLSISPELSAWAVWKISFDGSPPIYSLFTPSKLTAKPIPNQFQPLGLLSTMRIGVVISG
jgi:hypothetical protein